MSQPFNFYQQNQNLKPQTSTTPTAAQFLQRYVNGTPWAHIDIAGVAMASNKTAVNQSWGSGFGVDLLNNWISENFEN